MPPLSFFYAVGYKFSNLIVCFIFTTQKIDPMTHEERLLSCKVCSNRQFDPNRGVICGLTMNYPTFEGDCSSFDSGSSQIAPGSSYRKASHTTNHMEPVSAGTRFAHFIIDSIPIFILGSLIALYSLYTGFAQDFFQSDSRLLDYIYGAIVSLIYYLFVEATTGRTLGKLITRTIVVNEDGTKPSKATLIKRSFCRLIPFNHFSFLGEGIGWHDTISGTRVVRKDSIGRTEDEDVLDRF